MQEEQIQGVESAEVASLAQETSTQPEVSKNEDYNWQRSRETLREQSHVIRNQQKLIDDLTARINSVISKEEEDEPLGIEEDDLVTGKHVRTLEQKIEKKVMNKVMKDVDQLIEKRERARAVKEVQSKPGYMETIEKYADKLEQHSPRLAARLKNDIENKDPEAALLAYEAIVNSKYYHDDQNRSVPKQPSKIAQKLSEPASGMTGTPGIQDAKNWQTRQIGEDLWNEFVKSTGYSEG